MKLNKETFMEANKTILQMKYARIVSIFAEQTGITLEDALVFFMHLPFIK